MKLLILAFVGFLVLMSIPSWRKRFLGKYVAITMAVGWAVAVAIVLIT